MMTLLPISLEYLSSMVGRYQAKLVRGWAGETTGRVGGENIIILDWDGENVEVSEAGLAGLRGGFLEFF